MDACYSRMRVRAGRQDRRRGRGGVDPTVGSGLELPQQGLRHPTGEHHPPQPGGAVLRGAGVGAGGAAVSAGQQWGAGAHL
eukprot:1179980-Prorocentrum_minimum.AAC.1